MRLTLREALRQPIRKPAIRKLELISQAALYSAGIVPAVNEQWFVLRPDAHPDVNAVAIPCSSFDAALSTLRRLF